MQLDRDRLLRSRPISRCVRIIMTETDFLGDLEKRHEKDWMLVGMSIIRTVAIIQARLTNRINMTLQNDVTAYKITGDSFKRQLRLAYGIGIIEKKHYDALAYLGKLRNKWAHEEDIETEFKDMNPLCKMLSSEDITKINTHVDNRCGHFIFACDIVCNEMATLLEGKLGTATY